MRGQAAGTSRRSWLGWLGVAGVILLAAQAGRSAFVAAEGERHPAMAHALWPSHPLPQVTLALASIGAAAREGKPPSAQALEQMRSAGRSDPLAFDPLLVTATEHLAAGNQARGERLLKAVLHREPRSWAAHFLLADLYVREQRIADSLIHVAVLGRRIRGGGVEPFAAGLALYLRDSAKVADVRPVLRTNAALRKSVMTSLAQDPSAAASLRQLTTRGDAGEEWFRIAFERELGAGNIAGARALLSAAQVGGGGTALTDWSASDEGGPLSWRLPASSDGVAEPVAGGPLRLVYYGRADAALAEHLLLLQPGRYRLGAQFSGTFPPGTFEWRVTCLQGGRPLASWPAAAGSSARVIDVPGDCLAQRIALWGRMGEFPRTAAAELQRVSLSPVGATP